MAGLCRMVINLDHRRRLRITRIGAFRALLPASAS
jgi:hypothetical protein